MGRPISTTVTLNAAVANGYAQAQTLGAAGNLALNGSLTVGGVGTPNAPRRAIVTSSGNDTGITFTFTGTARSEQGGAVISETVAGTNGGDAASTLDFATVTSIAASGATAGNVTAGTNVTGSGPWVVWSSFAPDFEVSAAGVVASGSPTWQVDYTYDNVFTNAAPTVFTHAVLNAEVANADGFFQNPVFASRLTLVAAGSVKLVQMQQGT